MVDPIQQPSGVRRTLSAVTDPDAVRRAIQHYDDIGEHEFLDRYGFREAHRYWIEHGGRFYPSKAILGVAFGFQFPDSGPLKSSEFVGGQHTVRPRLESLGFTVVERSGNKAAGRPETAGRDWSASENEIIVRNYLDLLAVEQRGERTNKAANNRNLQGLLPGRSRGSIEYKLQNISAVLDSLERPWIAGYKPALNIQQSLIDAVTKVLSADQDEAPPPETPPVLVPTLESPPPSRNVGPGDPAERVRRAVKVDFAMRDARNRRLGRAGEEWVVAFEKKRLSTAGRPDLAERVIWTSQDRGDGLGYDVESYEADGTGIFIEVKTTNGGSRSPFLISAAELDAARTLGAAYRLYRVYGFSTGPRAFAIPGPLDASCRLEPAVYRARFG